MVLLGVAQEPRLSQAARTLDPTDRADKRALDRLAAQATSIAGAHDKREAGTRLHALSEIVDRDEPLPRISTQDAEDLAAYLAATIHLDILHIERLVVVDSLKVGGTPDRICHYSGPGPDGQPFDGNLIVDLKTGSIDHGALKMAMQLAVYSRGHFYDHRHQIRTPLPDVDQQWGLIVHLPAGTATCAVHWIDLHAGWQAALVAQRVRDMRATKRLLTPFRPPTPRITAMGVAHLSPHV